MKILKSANPGPVAEGEEAEAKKLNFKDIIEKIGKRNLIVIGSVLAISLVVYLNWFLLGDDPVDQPTGSQSAEKADDYFTASVLNRSRARDEAMEVLQTVVDSSSSSKEASASALADISRIAKDIEKEANIESLVKSKGFAECVAVISGNGINIVVKCNELLPSDIAQIKEIAYENAEILPENVVIIQK